ncbi:hypothetical protein FRC12_007781 [Ceratobasidium sp. 428]|nr:hypothetical protein FRC12_007781 [Ceratobasidium sp. 428]
MDESFSEPVQFPTLNPTASTTSDRSANRISISYANSTRRLVIDADVVKKVRILRAKARVEITFRVGLVGEGDEKVGKGEVGKEKAEEKVEDEEKAGAEKGKEKVGEDTEKEKAEEKKGLEDVKALALGEQDRFRGVLASRMPCSSLDGD